MQYFMMSWRKSQTSFNNLPLAILTWTWVGNRGSKCHFLFAEIWSVTKIWLHLILLFHSQLLLFYFHLLVDKYTQPNREPTKLNMVWLWELLFCEATQMFVLNERDGLFKLHFLLWEEEGTQRAGEPQ